ncbi:MAG: DM13 domain-containing protein [Saprospiraceae bacterium]|nr:DM13 domain-containing protein [Saprospiraceae bacterium]
MRRFLPFFLLFAIISCKKDNEVSNLPTIELLPTDKLLASGTFTNGAHTTSGDVKLIESADTKKYLIFNNLKSDAGPDLRIYLSSDKSASSYTEVVNKVTTGNTKIEIPSSANLATQKTVLIWCKQFSVLFGSADLK